MSEHVMKAGDTVTVPHRIPDGAVLDDDVMAVDVVCNTCKREHKVTCGVGGGDVDVVCLCGKWYSFTFGPWRRA